MHTLYRDLAISVHLIGVILWIGGTAAAAIVALAGAREPEGPSRTAALTAASRAHLFLATPGILLAWIAGLAYLIPNFTQLYAHAGWMHAKLTIALVLSALTGIFRGRLRKAAAGKKPPAPGLFAAVVLIVVLGAAAVVMLAELQP